MDKAGVKVMEDRLPIKPALFDYFVSIVNWGLVYYEEMVDAFPKDFRMREQLCHVKSLQDSTFKVECNRLSLRTGDRPYLVVLLKDAIDLCDDDMKNYAQTILDEIDKGGLKWI